MANSPALSRKDMREPDRFQVVANKAAAWMAARKRNVALVAGAAAGLVVLIIVVGAVRASSARSAGVATAALLELTGAPVMAQPAEGATTKSFPTAEAKQKALVAEADKVLAAHGVGRATVLAVLVRADAHYALKEWDPAAADYQRYLAEAPKDDTLRFGALEGLALVAEAKGDLPGAAAAYERMGRDAPRFSDRADLGRARVLAAAGKVDEARGLLGKFGEAHKDSALKDQAGQELAQLGAK